MQFRTLLLIIFCGLLHSSVTYGQTQIRSHGIVKARFTHADSILWIQTFTGTWQSFHPIEMVLGYDGHTYHGRLRLLKEELTFDLQGYHKDGQAIIQEIDQTGRTSGYLVLQINDGKMTGQWWSVDFSRSATLALRSGEVVELRRFEPELMQFSGRIGNAEISMTLQREEVDLLSGFLFSDDDDKVYRLIGRCDDGACDNMQFEVKSAGGTLSELHCTLLRNAFMRFQLNDQDEVKEGTATLLRKYPMQRLHSLRYIGQVDCIYPVLSLPTFDNWLKTQMETWYAMALHHVDSLQKAYETPGPSERWSVQATAWIDITLVTLDKVSGVMTQYNPERQAYERMAFIFDIKNAKLLPVKDLGKKTQFENDLLQDALLVKDIEPEHPDDATWLETVEFRHIALSEDGFILFTDFNPIHGELWVKLKYADYVEAMKRNAFVLELMNK